MVPILQTHELEDTPMKPRSTVTALLAITETLIAARAKAAQAKQGASKPMRESKLGRLLRAEPTADAADQAAANLLIPSAMFVSEVQFRFALCAACHW